MGGHRGASRHRNELIRERVCVRRGHQWSAESVCAGLVPVERNPRQDRCLPVANIARIMKRVLPANEKIAKEAKEALQECVSEFICFVTSEASDRCVTEKRKTINGDDIIWAMGTLGFDAYVSPLKVYLSKYRYVAKADKSERANR